MPPRPNNRPRFVPRPPGGRAPFTGQPGANLGGVSAGFLQQLGHGEALRGGIGTLLGLSGHDYYNDAHAEKRQDDARAQAYQHELQRLASAREEREANRRAAFKREDARDRAAQARTDEHETHADARHGADRAAEDARAQAGRDATATRQRTGIGARVDADARMAAERAARETPATHELELQKNDEAVQGDLRGGLRAKLPFGLGDLAQKAIDQADPAGSGYDPVASKKYQGEQGHWRAEHAKIGRDERIDATRAASAQRQKDTQAAIAGRFKERMDRLDAALARKEIDRPRYELEKIKAELYHANDNPFTADSDKKTPDQIDAEAAARYGHLFPGQPMPTAQPGVAVAAVPPAPAPVGIGSIAAAAATPPAAKLPMSAPPQQTPGGAMQAAMANPFGGQPTPDSASLPPKAPLSMVGLRSPIDAMLNPGGDPNNPWPKAPPAPGDAITAAARAAKAHDDAIVIGGGLPPGPGVMDTLTGASIPDAQQQVSVVNDKAAARVKSARGIIDRATDEKSLEAAHDDVVKAVGGGFIDPQHAQELMDALEKRRQTIMQAHPQGVDMMGIGSGTFGGAGGPGDAGGGGRRVDESDVDADGSRVLGTIRSDKHIRHADGTEDVIRGDEQPLRGFDISRDELGGRREPTPIPNATPEEAAQAPTPAAVRLPMGPPQPPLDQWQQKRAELDAHVLRAGRTDGSLGANPHGNFTIDNPPVMDPDQEPGNAEHDFDMDALPENTRAAYAEYLRRQKLVGQGYRYWSDTTAAPATANEES